MRKLAHIEKIEWKRPIEGADRIELVGVLGWQCIAKKDEFNVGDYCVYIEIDSIVDKENPDFAFLEKKHYKIKTMKMKGVLSQGIVFPLTILKEKKNYEIGDDVTNELKITKIEDEIPKQKEVNPMDRIRQKNKKLYKNKVFKWFMKFRWFRFIAFKLLIPKKKPKNFPDWIIKTDETRLQNIPFVLEEYKDKPMVLTEKLDGTSTSFGLRKEKKRKENTNSQSAHEMSGKKTSTKNAITTITYITKWRLSTTLKKFLSKFWRNSMPLPSSYKVKPLANQFKRINMDCREEISMRSI